MAAPDEDGADTGPDMTAAELALGVLEGEERARALRRVLADPAFAQEVADWRRRLDTLVLEAPAVEPEPEVERRVMASVAGPQVRTSTSRWQAATGIATAVAAVLAGLLVLRPGVVVRDSAPAASVEAAPTTLVAVIAPEGAAPFSAVYDRAAREVRLAGMVAVPRGRDAELWAIGADGVPRALGLVTNAAGRRVAAGAILVAAGTTLAISIEPVGGSPGPAPTGPVVATGTLISI